MTKATYKSKHLIRYFLIVSEGTFMTLMMGHGSRKAWCLEQ